jgi:DnaA family protein
MKQLPLGVRWPNQSTFANYLAGPNRQIVQEMRTLAERPRVLWISGPAASGKTHLLQAVCNEAGAAGRRAAYLPLDPRAGLAPAALAGCEQLDVVCLDDIDHAAGSGHWEGPLFSLYNELLEHQRSVVIAASAAPANFRWRLADLASRMNAALVLTLRPLQEREQLAALALHASARGLELPEETANYLMTRFPRDLRTLCGLLDTLDTASLAARRRLTVPFIKQVIDEREASG